jgi:hypothetical protein
VIEDLREQPKRTATFERLQNLAPYMTMNQIMLDHSGLRKLSRHAYMQLQQLRAEILKRIAQ